MTRLRGGALDPLLWFSLPTSQVDPDILIRLIKDAKLSRSGIYLRSFVVENRPG